MGRMRSPNFPVLPLEESIDVAKAIWDKNRKAPIAREAAAKDLGYSGLTGRSMQVLGSLNQYGLVEGTTKGLTRVTELAEEIFIGFPEEVKRKAITKAGRTPALFQEIYEKFDGHVPGENAIRSFLFQRGFTNDGVEKALKTFSSTNRFVEINGVSESYGNSEKATSELPPEVSDVEDKMIEVEEFEAPVKKGGVTIFTAGPLDFQLSTNGLRLTGQTSSSKELKAFIAKLTALAVLLPEDTDGEA